MNLSELIRQFRVESNDKVEPYFVEDQDVTAWLNEAVEEACVRGRLVHESQAPEVCQIQVTAGNSQYKLHEALYEITQVYFDPGQDQTIKRVRLASEEYLTRTYYEDWPLKKGHPEFAIQSDTGLRLVPCPDEDGLLMLEGYRGALTPMVEDDDSPVDLFRGHHVHLINWALHKAFSVSDGEFFDPNRAQIALSNFTAYFGERPDADLRRQTREDTDHRIEAFFP